MLVLLIKFLIIKNGLPVLQIRIWQARGYLPNLQKHVKFKEYEGQIDQMMYKNFMV